MSHLCLLISIVRHRISVIFVQYLSQSRGDMALISIIFHSRHETYSYYNWSVSHVRHQSIPKSFKHWSYQTWAIIDSVVHVIQHRLRSDDGNTIFGLLSLYSYHRLISHWYLVFAHQYVSQMMNVLNYSIDHSVCALLRNSNSQWRGALNSGSMEFILCAT